MLYFEPLLSRQYIIYFRDVKQLSTSNLACSIILIKELYYEVIKTYRVYRTQIIEIRISLLLFVVRFIENDKNGFSL